MLCFLLTSEYSYVYYCITVFKDFFFFKYQVTFIFLCIIVLKYEEVLKYLILSGSIPRGGPIELFLVPASATRLN